MTIRAALAILALAAGLLAAWFWTRGDGITPLMKVAHGGDTAEVARLIHDGARPDAQDNVGWTALMMAASQGQTDAAQLLVKAGADPNLRSGPVPAAFETTPDYPPTTALTEAISNRHLALAAYLLDHGARVDPWSMALAGEFADPALLARMLATGARIDAVSDIEWGRTPLSRAARSGNLENMSWLIAHGADPNLALPNTSNLQEAIRDLHPGAVDILLAAGADPNGRVGSLAFSPLWEAVLTPGFRPAPHARTTIVAALMRQGADPLYVPDGMGRGLAAQVRQTLRDCEAGYQGPAHGIVAMGRYLQCTQESQHILDLLLAAEP